MNTYSLEPRLREKITTEIPRPGFETRIQAMAREPFIPDEKGLTRRFALPALAVLAIGVVLSPKDEPTQQPLVVTPAPRHRTLRRNRALQN